MKKDERLPALSGVSPQKGEESIEGASTPNCDRSGVVFRRDPEASGFG